MRFRAGNRAETRVTLRSFLTATFSLNPKARARLCLKSSPRLRLGDWQRNHAHHSASAAYLTHAEK